MVVSKWNVQKLWTGSGKPWLAWAPDGLCDGHCHCASFATQPEALAYALAAAS